MPVSRSVDDDVCSSSVEAEASSKSFDDSDLPSLVLLDILYEIVVAGQIFSVNKVYSQASLQYYNNSTTVCNPEIEALDFGLSWLSLFLFLRLQQLPFQFTCRRHLVKKSTA